MKNILKKIGLATVVTIVATSSLASGVSAQAYYFSGNYNVPPVWESKSTLSVAQGNTLSFTVKAEDANLDLITYSAVRLPNGAAFNPSTRLVTFSPNYEQLGTFPLVLAATDSRSNPVNRPKTTGKHLPPRMLERRRTLKLLFWKPRCLC